MTKIKCEKDTLYFTLYLLHFVCFPMSAEFAGARILEG